MTEFAELRDLLLMRLSDWADSPSSTSSVEKNAILSMIRADTGPAKAQQVLNSLLNDGYLTVGDLSHSEFELTPQLFVKAEEIKKRRTGSRIREEHRGNSRSAWGSSWDHPANLNTSSNSTAQQSSAAAVPGASTYDNGSTSSGHAPASDRVVGLDHNSSAYQEAASSLDRLIVAFKQDHRLDNELGQERPALVRALEAARLLLNDGSVRTEAAQVLIFEPLRLLRQIAVRYERELIAGLAATAMAAIGRLLGVV